MTRWRAAVTLATGAILASAALPAHAHVAQGRVIAAKPISVEFKYADGEPMAFASVSVFGPQPTALYQTGKTDALGRFSFIATAAGNWRVEAQDEEKHKAAIDVPLASPDRVGKPWQHYLDILLVVSLIGNVALVGVASKRWKTLRPSG